jgi:hypothetical protein
MKASQKSSQVGYGELGDKRPHSIAETDKVNRKQWVFNSA